LTPLPHFFSILLNSAVDTRKPVRQKWAKSVKISATMKKQFSLTRAALTTCGRPKANFLPV
jgi:hypothetical protein